LSINPLNSHRLQLAKSPNRNRNTPHNQNNNSGFRVVCLPLALFSARVSEWEFIKRAAEESRSAPAMLAFCKANQHPKIKTSRMVW
jgi:hypothetical protein